MLCSDWHLWKEPFGHVVLVLLAGCCTCMSLRGNWQPFLGMNLNVLSWPSRDLPLLWIPVSEYQSSEALGWVQDKWSTWHRSSAHPPLRPVCAAPDVSLNTAWTVSRPFPHCWAFSFFSTRMHAHMHAHTHKHAHMLEQCYAWLASLTNKNMLECGGGCCFFQVTSNMLNMQFSVLCCLL